MAYNVKYRDTHKTRTGATVSTAVVEILQDGWAGAVTEVKGHADSGVYRLSYPKIDVKNPFENPIQKSSLEYYLVCQSPANNLGYNGQSILDEIFGSDEQEYRMRLTIDGAVEWEGPVLTDLLEYPEGEYTYWGKIVAKDLTRLSGFSYPLAASTNRIPVIEAIAGILSDLNLSLPIYTYTSWATTTGASSDILNSLYIDTYALRQYADSGNEEDQPIPSEEALERLLRNYCLILRQSGGAWRLYQFSEIADDPTAVLETQYDASGAFVSDATADITVDIDQTSRFILAGGVNTGITSLKSARVTYDHRSTVSYLKLPGKIEVAGLGNESFSDFFQSNGNQSLRLTGDVTAKFSSAIDQNVTGLIRFEVAGYYWNGSSWVGSAADVKVPLSAPDGRTFSGPYEIETTQLPADADGTVNITYNGALADGGAVPDTTTYKGNNFTIQNPSVEEGGSEAIQYQLTQPGGYSKNYDHGDTWYGVGPASYSRSAIRFSNDELATDTFLRRGEDTATYEGNLHKLILREILDVLRSSTRVLQGPLKGDYSPHKVGVYNTKPLFFIGGDLTGYENTWEAKLWELSFALDSNDDFSTVFKDIDSSRRGVSIDQSYNGIALENRRYNERQKITETTGALSGTVTSIPIKAVPSSFVNVGDRFYVFNIKDGSLTDFILAEPQLSGATTLKVESRAVTGTIPSGSWIIYTGEDISTVVTRTDNAFRFSVRGDWEYMTDSDGDPIQFSDGEPLIDAEINTNVVENKVSSEIALLQSQVIIKSDGAGGLAEVRLDSRAKEGSRIGISADYVLINNINFDRAAGTIASDNFEEGSAGWRIRGNGDAEFNNVVVRESLVTNTEIRNITVKTGDVTIINTAQFTNEDEDFSLAADGLSTKLGFSGVKNPGEIDIVIETALRLGRQYGDPDDSAGFVAGYNDGATPTVDEGVLYLVGGYDASENSAVGKIHLESTAVLIEATSLDMNVSTINLNGQVSANNLAAAGSLNLKGASAPGTPADGAFVYIDDADGDLKVVFENGTTKTIITDD